MYHAIIIWRYKNKYKKVYVTEDGRQISEENCLSKWHKSSWRLPNHLISNSMTEAVSSDDNAEGPMHFTSPWNSSFSFSGIRSCPIACKKKEENQENNLQEKKSLNTALTTVFTGKILDTWCTHHPGEVSKPWWSCLPWHSVFRGSWDQSSSAAQPSSFWLHLHRGFSFWIAAEISMPALHSVLTLHQHQHWTPRACAGKGSKDRSFFSQPFPSLR